MKQREAEIRRTIISWRQFLALAAVAVGAYFLISFGNLVLTAYQLNLRAEQLRGEIKSLQAENEDLQRQVQALKEPAAVEEIARTELGWVRAGETQVVVSVEPGSVVAVPPTTPAIAGDRPTWRRWLDLFLQTEP